MHVRCGNHEVTNPNQKLNLSEILSCSRKLYKMALFFTFEHKWRKTCQNVLALLKLLMSISGEMEDEKNLKSWKIDDKSKKAV